MKRSLLVYAVLLGTLFIRNFEVTAMETSAAQQAHAILVHHSTLQEREKKADFILIKSFLVSERGRSMYKTVTLDKEGTIQLWDTLSGELLKTLETNYSHKGVRDVRLEGERGTILAIFTTIFLIRAAAL
ncbi:hypothetical protein H0X06_02195 [Candidatus Dependentiae bacterium]|nr:hypothetical protein [Candidatus Dependentiae bacterium]